MAIKVKPTKIKKEKPIKAPKAPKPKKVAAPKNVKVSGGVSPMKAKQPKPANVKQPKPTKSGGVKISSSKRNSSMAKISSFGKPDTSKNSKIVKILAVICVALIVVAILSIATVNIVEDVQEQNNAPVSASIGDFPKLSYYVGEEADYTGLSVAITKNNGKIEYVKYSAENASDFEFSGFDSTRPYDDKTITVIYKGLSFSYHITVKEVPKPKPTLVGITIDVMPKTEYKVGEWLDTDGGMLLKHYSDGTTARTIMVNNYIIDGWGEAWEGGPGTYTLTVKYKEDGSKAVKTTYEITILDPNAAPEGE